MICIRFFKMLYLTFVRWWIVDFEIEFSKYYLMMAIWLRNEWIPELITNFGWEEKIRSIQGTDFPWIWVGSLIIFCSPNCEVIASVLEVVVSPVYQLLDFVLKSPMATIKKGLVAETASRFSSKSLQKFSKSCSDWFGDPYKERRFQILSPSFISKVIHS